MSKTRAPLLSVTYAPARELLRLRLSHGWARKKLARRKTAMRRVGALRASVHENEIVSSNNASLMCYGVADTFGEAEHGSMSLRVVMHQLNSAT